MKPILENRFTVLGNRNRPSPTIDETLSYVGAFNEVGLDPRCHRSQMTMCMTSGSIVYQVRVGQGHRGLWDLDPPLILPTVLYDALPAINLANLKGVF